MSSPPRRIGDVPLDEFRRQFPDQTYYLDYGACRVRVCAQLAGWPQVLRQVYGAFRALPASGFNDLHVRILPGKGLRRLVRPTARFSIDGIEPFEPFPRASALPLFEWGVNWCFAQRFNQYVLLHAGSLAIGDRAVIMAAVPGSGKSTLSAAMMLSGFRLLSDEFGVLDPETGRLLPMLKPVALKNRAIDVIRRFSEYAVIGPTFPATRKGDVAHLGPNAASVDAAHESARPRLIIFPRYRPDAPTTLTPQAREQAFARLAFNSFNYGLLGPVSFYAVADVAQSCPAYQLEYSDLADAITRLRELLLAEGAAPR